MPSSFLGSKGWEFCVVSVAEGVDLVLVGRTFDRFGVGSVFGSSIMGCGFPIGSGIFGEAIDRPAFLERILG